MEIFIQIILLLSLVKYCLKAAISGRLGYISIFTACAGVIAIGIYPIIIYSPINIIDTILNNQKIVTNGALLTTIESVAGIMLSIKLLDYYFLPKNKRTKWMRIFRFIPGFIFILSIAYFEMLFFSYRVGSNFLLSSLLFSLILMICIFSTSILLKYLIPHESQKLEFKIIINIIILFLGLLINSMVSDYNISAAKTVIDWWALISLLGIGLVFTLLGFYLFRKKTLR